MAVKSPASWLAHLEAKLAEQQRSIQIFEDYYDGRHRLAFATLKFRETFGWLFQALADNWCEIVVDAPVERLAVEGFRMGRGKPADEGAWDIWQANGLDAQSVMAHTEAVKDGAAYILVAPKMASDDFPRITVEHASQVYVAFAPGDRRKRLAAIKKWRDEEDGYIYANIFLPGEVCKFRSQQPRSPSGPAEQRVRDWMRKPGDEGGPIDSGGVVPMIPLLNNPTMLGGGRSDLLPAIPLQDAINKELADMLVASEFGAFIQRWATGITVDTDETGKPTSKNELLSSVARLMVSEQKDAKFGQFEASDLSNYTNAIAMLLQHLAAQTRTPPHYLLGQIVNASGDALKAAETGLVAKVKRKQIDFSDSWEEAIRLALRFNGATEPSEALGAETIWRDPEYRSEGEQVDAAIKLRGLGVPLEALWERIGATPQQVTEWSEKLGLPERVATIKGSQVAREESSEGETGELVPPPPTIAISERTQT